MFRKIKRRTKKITETQLTDSANTEHPHFYNYQSPCNESHPAFLNQASALRKRGDCDRVSQLSPIHEHPVRKSDSEATSSNQSVVDLESNNSNTPGEEGEAEIIMRIQNNNKRKQFKGQDGRTTTVQMSISQNYKDQSTQDILQIQLPPGVD